VVNVEQGERIMRRMGYGIGAVSYFFCAAVALAHPGHGVTPPDSPWHYAVEPVHAVWPLLLMALIGGAFLVRRQRRESRRRAVALREQQKTDSQTGPQNR
jgi:hypothetical protein